MFEGLTPSRLAALLPLGGTAIARFSSFSFFVSSSSFFFFFFFSLFFFFFFFLTQHGAPMSCITALFMDHVNGSDVSIEFFPLCFFKGSLPPPPPPPSLSFVERHVGHVLTKTAEIGVNVLNCLSLLRGYIGLNKKILFETN